MGVLLHFALLPALMLAQTQSTFYAAWEDGRDAERRGRYPAALEAYQRAAELRPRSAQYLYESILLSSA